MLVFIETHTFSRQIVALISDAGYASLQGSLIVHPEAGDLIQGTGGLRKIRWQEPHAVRANEVEFGSSTTGMSPGP